MPFSRYFRKIDRTPTSPFCPNQKQPQDVPSRTMRMNSYLPQLTTLPLARMQEEAVACVKQLEEASLLLPQVEIATEHIFHAGMYARTIMVPAGVSVTGAQIQIPTLVIINGDVLIYGEDGANRHTGYYIALGQEGRKQAFYALEDTYITMIFPTTTTTVAEAEKEFTHEYEKLLSNKEKNPCPEQQQQ